MFKKILMFLCMFFMITLFDDIYAAETWSSGTISAKTYNANETINLNGNVTLAGKITITSGATLTIQGTGKITRGTSYTGNLFVVEEGGALVIQGSTSNKNAITVDGNENVISQAAAIITRGPVTLKNMTLSNNKNRANKSAGGGLYVYNTGSLSMNNCLLTKNTSCAFGGGFYSAGNITITNSEISYNRSMTTATAEAIGYGRGGGFLLTGQEVTGTLTNVNIHDNVALYYGGAMQIQAGASVHFDSGVISNNEAVLAGAGGVHVTSAAIFTMDDGATIKNNTAHLVGGAIHTSYSCKVNLNGGEITGNTTVGRGGGVHINVGGELVLNGTDINNNKALSGRNVSISTVDEKGDTWSTPTSKDSDEYKDGYGGGVLVDSGICTMKKGTLSNNFATKGGAGIGFVMISMGDTTSEDKMNKIVSFTMEGGTITNNSTDGDGGGIYLMKNMLAEDTTDEEGNVIPGVDGTPTITLKSGTISNNTAKGNGGAAYLEEETAFYIDGSVSLTNNRAEGNGGAVYVSQGIADITGGTISENYAKNNGGAIYVNGTVTVNDTTISENGTYEDNITQNGGSIYIENGDFLLESGLIENNTASNFGGAVYIEKGNATVTGGTITECLAKANGGAIYIVGGNFIIESGAVTNNTAQNQGGALYVSKGDIEVGLKSCKGDNTTHSHPQIRGNVAQAGGGFCVCDGTLDMYCGEVRDNYAEDDTASSNVNQTAGTINIHGGTIHNGISVLSGSFNDYTKENCDIIYTLRYHSNDGTDRVIEAKVSSGAQLSLSNKIFSNGETHLIAWKTDLNDDTLWYVDSTYTMNGDADLYAIWNIERIEPSYIIYIPESLEFYEDTIVTINISAEMEHFSNISYLEIVLDGIDKLSLNENTDIKFNYDLINNSTNRIISNGDRIAYFSLEDYEEKTLKAKLKSEPNYSGIYTDLMTFQVNYHDDV